MIVEKYINTEWMFNTFMQEYCSQALKTVCAYKVNSDGHRSFAYVRLVFTNDFEVHLTTDGAYANYEIKRKTVPRIVYIFDHLSTIKKVCEEFGYLVN